MGAKSVKHEVEDDDGAEVFHLLAILPWSCCLAERLGHEKEEYLQEIERLRDEHRHEILAINAQHRDEIQHVLEEKENVVNEVVSQRDAVVIAKEGDHPKKVDHTKNNIEYLKDIYQLNSALIPFKYLPEELHSLQVVLELKNEEIRKARLKTIELEKRVDEYYDLKTKFDSVSQENASLKESLKKRKLSERQVSIERDTLLEKFEMEIKKVNLLAMEKEELMWRASNPD